MEQTAGLWMIAKNAFLLGRKVDERVAKDVQLSPIEVNILTYLYRFSDDDATASGIEREHKFKKNTISVHVETLVQAGYVERKERSGDRRRVELALTDTGETIAKACLAEHEKLRSALLVGLTKDDLSALQRCLTVMNENALSLLKG